MPRPRRSLYAVAATPGTLAAMLIEARARENMTQEELAKLVGVQPKTISAWERGDRPQPRFYKKLVDLKLLPVASVTELRDVLDRTRAETTESAAGSYENSREAVMRMTEAIVGRARDLDREMNEAEAQVFLEIFKHHAAHESG